MRVVPEDVRFCDECKPDAAPIQPRAERLRTDAIMLEYDSQAWQAIRRICMQRHPYCYGYRAQCNELSKVADHNIPARVITRVCRALGLFPYSKYPGFYIVDNLIGLCHGCHNRKSKTEDAEDWSEQLVTILIRYLPVTIVEGERRAKVLEAYRR